MPALALIALLAAPPAPEPWPAVSGSGLLTLPDTRTLAPGRFRGGIAADNRDRDPLGLDLLDGCTDGAPGR